MKFPKKKNPSKSANNSSEPRKVKRGRGELNFKVASNVHHVGLHQCYREIFIKLYLYLYFYLVLYLYCFFYHIFIPIHIFDLGESLPQWEQSQGREFKHNQPNEGRVFAKSGVSIKKKWFFNDFPYHEYFSGNHWSSELVITIWMRLPWLERLLTLMSGTGLYPISKPLSMVKVYIGFIPFVNKV